MSKIVGRSLDVLSEQNLHRFKSNVSLFSPSTALAEKAEQKKQQRHSLEIQLEKCLLKRTQILGKIEIKQRHGVEHSVLSSLLIKVEYRIQVLAGMVADRAKEKEEARLDPANSPLVGQVVKGKPTGLGYIKRTGKTVPNSGLSVPADLLAMSPKPVVPEAKPKVYIVKRRMLRDKTAKLGTVQRPSNSFGAGTVDELLERGLRKTNRRRKPKPVDPRVAFLSRYAYCMGKATSAYARGNALGNSQLRETGRRWFESACRARDAYIALG